MNSFLFRKMIQNGISPALCFAMISNKIMIPFLFGKKIQNGISRFLFRRNRRNSDQFFVSYFRNKVFNKWKPYTYILLLYRYVFNHDDSNDVIMIMGSITTTLAANNS
jgi:hypothetical protein